jgi:hypothetical protein
MKEIVNTVLRTDGVLEIYVGNRLFVEVEDGRSDKDFIEDVLYDMGYDWLEDGTIRPRFGLPITKEAIYDEMCKVLTNYENAEDGDKFTEYELYEMLVKIQRHWEDVITVQND